MVQNFKIKGKQVAIENFLREIKKDSMLSVNPGVSIGSIVSISDTTALRKPLGLEPLVYFVVAYSAHLAAGITHDVVRSWLKRHAEKSSYKISIEEEDERPKKN